MSNTRYAEPGAPLHQERYASSPEYKQGLYAQHVARRCGVFKSAEDRELIWSLQRRSWEDGGLEALAEDLLRRFPQYIGTESMHKFGTRAGGRYHAEQVKKIRAELEIDSARDTFILKDELTRDERRTESYLLAVRMDEGLSAAQEKELNELGSDHPANYPVQAFLDVCQEKAAGLPELLERICLDPEYSFFSCWYLNDLRAALRDYFTATIAEQSAGVVVTQIGRIVGEALDYAMEQRCMVLIDGLARTGKSFATKAWCDARPGRVRYVQVPASNDDASFFIAIARALNISIESGPKANKVRDRVERVLQDGDLTVIFDEAHYLWPQSNYHHAKPKRINWINTALVNHGVPVALVTTPQFFKARMTVEQVTGWSAQQFDGRLGHYERLPDSLGSSDLAAVARVKLAKADEESISALVNFAVASNRYLAGIDAVASRATYIAKKNGRTEPSRQDVRQAIKQNVIPSDSALAAALTPKESAERRAAAATQRGSGRKAAASMPASAARGQTPISTDILSAADRTRPAAHDLASALSEI